MENKNKYVILITILFQPLVIIIFTFLMLNSVSLTNLKKSLPFLNFIIAVITVLMVISIKKLSHYERKEAEFQSMKANMENIEDLIKLLNSQKHDYLTHIQTISALLYLEEYEELSNYLKGISSEYKFTNEIVRFGHPALTALINAKREIAQEKGIFFYVKCKHKINYIEIDSWELCNLISNVIENAIEAVSMIKGKQWIKIIADYSDENFIFEIENRGYIEEKIIKNLFEPGITNKTSSGRGYGLYISKKIVDKYKGTIEIKNTDDGTVMSTISLPRKVDSYDKKIS